MRLHTGGCTDRVGKSICTGSWLCGKKIPCRTGDSNPRQYCSWLLSRTLYPLSYHVPTASVDELRKIPSTEWLFSALPVSSKKQFNGTCTQAYISVSLLWKNDSAHLRQRQSIAEVTWYRFTWISDRNFRWMNKGCTLVGFMYLVFTRMPGESYRRRLRSLLYLCYVFRALIKCLVCWFISLDGLNNE